MDIVLYINIIIENFLEGIIIKLIGDLIIEWEWNENGWSIYEIMNISNEIIGDYNDIISLNIILEYISIITIILIII